MQGGTEKRASVKKFGTQKIQPANNDSNKSEVETLSMHVVTSEKTLSGASELKSKAKEAQPTTRPQLRLQNSPVLGPTSHETNIDEELRLENHKGWKQPLKNTSKVDKQDEIVARLRTPEIWTGDNAKKESAAEAERSHNRDAQSYSPIPMQLQDSSVQYDKKYNSTINSLITNVTNIAQHKTTRNDRNYQIYAEL